MLKNPCQTNDQYLCFQGYYNTIQSKGIIIILFNPRVLLYNRSSVSLFGKLSPNLGKQCFYGFPLDTLGKNIFFCLFQNPKISSWKKFNCAISFQTLQRCRNCYSNRWLESMKEEKNKKNASRILNKFYINEELLHKCIKNLEEVL